MVEDACINVKLQENIKRNILISNLMVGSFVLPVIIMLNIVKWLKKFTCYWLLKSEEKNIYFWNVCVNQCLRLFTWLSCMHLWVVYSNNSWIFFKSLSFNFSCILFAILSILYQACYSSIISHTSVMSKVMFFSLKLFI